MIAATSAGSRELSRLRADATAAATAISASAGPIDAGIVCTISTPASQTAAAAAPKPAAVTKAGAVAAEPRPNAVASPTR